ncbi:MAG: hypothetical protein HYZ50_02980 [Deltaproteobacteria bacterium]|nr:hypothetical protein [Deltaproteobacteria bacterium]
MHTVEEITEEVKLLSPQERLHLMEKIDHLGRNEENVADETQLAALDTFLALAGTAETVDTDVSSDKYRHLAEIYSDRHELP